jgi:pyruvate dehydrogenase E2 component (dihydrolipoamide acetyltransferase)
MPEIQMPKLSDTMTEGTVVSWKKKVGDQVNAGEVLAEIETDKATMEWEATDDGVLKEIYVQAGGKVNVGDRIAFIGSGEDESPNENKGEKKNQHVPKPKSRRRPKPRSGDRSCRRRQRDETRSRENGNGCCPRGKIRFWSGQSLAACAQDRRGKNLDLTKIKGTGPGGRIVEKDLAAAASAQAAGKAPAPLVKAPTPAIAAGESARINLTGMRKVIAERLSSSLGPIPHFYLNIEINADSLMRLRAELKSADENDDAGKITVNDFILKAAVAAALREPKVNASFDGDAIVQYGDINLAVAVAIDEGLVTPVIRSAQNKSLREISAAVKDLAHRARSKRMKPEEFQGGTLTVSNLGSYGIDYFSAVINPPQAIILSVGAIVRQAVVNEAGEIVPGYRMKVGMSCDHRVVDGAIGAEYLKALRQLLENPSRLLL